MQGRLWTIVPEIGPCQRITCPNQGDSHGRMALKVIVSGVYNGDSQTPNPLLSGGLISLTAPELEDRTADGRYLVTNSEDSAVRVFGL